MQFCSQCGLRLGDGARFCGVCGRDAYAPATPPPIPIVPPASGADGMPPVMPPPSRAPISRTPMIIAAIAIAASLAVTAYVLVIAPDDSVTEQAAEQTQTRFVTAKANIRNRSAVTGSAIVGQVERGARLTGVLVAGPDARYPWLELADGRGFVSSVNMAVQAPPALARSFADVAWFAQGRTVLLAAPYESSSPVETVADRARVVLTGITANGFVEVKRSGGGVGYFRAPAGFDPERQPDPIAFRLSDSGCDYGPEMEALFASFVDDFRRTARPEDEGSSQYRRIDRTMLGLTVTAIGIHSEASSIHFREDAAQAIQAFRAAGYQFIEDGQFGSNSIMRPKDEVYGAGIRQSDDTETRRQGASYFICGL